MIKYALVLCFLLSQIGCGSPFTAVVVGQDDSQEIEYQKFTQEEWNKEFEPFERMAVGADQITMDPSCKFVTVHTEKGDFRAELAVEIKNEKECFETWENQSKTWDYESKSLKGYSENRFYLTRVEDYNRPDVIVVDITSGGADIQALLVGTWITNGLAVPTLPMVGGVDYFDSTLHAMMYDDKNFWKDHPKPVFNKRDLVADNKEPGVIYQVISVDFGKDGKNIAGYDADFDGWYYHCMELVGPKAGKHFKYVAEHDLLRERTPVSDIKE